MFVLTVPNAHTTSGGSVRIGIMRTHTLLARAARSRASMVPVAKRTEPEAKPPKRARYREDGTQRVPFYARLRPDIKANLTRKADRRGITANALLEETLIAAGFGKPEPEPDSET